MKPLNSLTATEYASHPSICLFFFPFKRLNFFRQQFYIMRINKCIIFTLYFFFFQASWTTWVPATRCGTYLWWLCFTGGIRRLCTSCTLDTASLAQRRPPGAKWNSSCNCNVKLPKNNTIIRRTVFLWPLPCQPNDKVLLSTRGRNKGASLSYALRHTVQLTCAYHSQIIFPIWNPH